MSQQLYFAYGSNLNQQDFDDWCSRRGFSKGLLRFHSKANLPDFDLAFSHRSSTRNGGVLDIKPRTGQLVPGVLFEVEAVGWDALDRKEGAPSVYERLNVQVLNDRGESQEAVTYRVCEKRKQPFVQPHPDYVKIVREGLNDWNIGDAQLKAVAKNIESECPDGFFFYGTLLRGEPRFAVLRQFGLECTLMAETFGRLLDLGGFPALVDTGSSDQLVQGDFVRLRNPERAIRKLDQIEGFNGFGIPNSLYRRTFVGVGVGDGRVRYGWTYCLADKARKAQQIMSGDWRQHLGHREKFLKQLVSEHSERDELSLATLIAERTTWRDQPVDEIAKSFLPLDRSLGRDEISERKMAQASGKWAVLV
jgi:gamma-glutamylcyclotransferase (GGCT)/AIG2-like uncharacterized protein YtfP